MTRFPFIKWILQKNFTWPSCGADSWPGNMGLCKITREQCHRFTLLSNQRKRANGAQMISLASCWHFSGVRAGARPRRHHRHQFVGRPQRGWSGISHTAWYRLWPKTRGTKLKIKIIVWPTVYGLYIQSNGKVLTGFQLSEDLLIRWAQTLFVIRHHFEYLYLQNIVKVHDKLKGFSFTPCNCKNEESNDD